jgi:adenosine deaminase
MTVINPLADISIPAEIANLPKADIHIHAEWSPRLDRVMAKRDGRPPYDWRAWADNLMKTEAPGSDRLRHISQVFPELIELDKDPENFIARIVEMLEEAASDGAVLIEIRFGKDLAERPDCLTLIREAERRVQVNYPNIHVAVIPFIFLLWDDEKLEPVINNTIAWAEAGLIFGADLFNQPYDIEADWTKAYKIADRLANAGLGMTAHVAETAPVNVESVLKMPGITRLGHATHVGYHPHLLELVAKSGVTIESSLSCNVILGASPSYEEHPIRQFVDAGIPIALCTDDPVQMSTTIGREYAIAHQLGFSTDELLQFTRNAIEAAFISADQRTMLLNKIASS